VPRSLLSSATAHRRAAAASRQPPTAAPAFACSRAPAGHGGVSRPTHGPTGAVGTPASPAPPLAAEEVGIGPAAALL